MRYLDGIPEDYLRSIFRYEPDSPSGLLKLQRCRKISDHVHFCKTHQRYLATVTVQNKCYRKYFPPTPEGRLAAQQWKRSEYESRRMLNPKVAGSVGKNGYWCVKFSYNGTARTMKNHRIIRFLCPDDQGCYLDLDGKFVDHIDNDKSNNRVENLRVCSQKQNCFNMKSRRNSTGEKGLSYDSKKNLFVARVMSGGVTHKRRFAAKRKKDAIAWLRETRERLHGDFHNHG